MRELDSKSANDAALSNGHTEPTQIYRLLSAPISLQWELTDWCNQKCFHCYNYWRGDGQSSDILKRGNIEVFDRTSSEIIDNRVFNVIITGGEPLGILGPVFPYLERLSRAGIELSLNSNLTLFDIDKAKMLHDVGINNILTSLTGSSAELHDCITNTPGSFRNALKGISLATNEGFRVTANMVVTTKNLFDICSTARLLKEMGVNNFCATKVTSPVNSEDFSSYVLSDQDFHHMLSELLSIRSDLGMNVDTLSVIPPCAFVNEGEMKYFMKRLCFAGKTTCAIGFEGSVRPCPHQDSKYGSVIENNGLSKAWSNLGIFRTSLFIPQECEDCSVKEMCGGGCKSEAKIRCGKFDSPDPYFKRPRIAIDIPHVSPEAIDLKNVDYYFSQRVKSRPEEFGGLLYSNLGSWLAVNKIVYDFFTKHKGTRFSSAEIESDMQIDHNNVGLLIKIFLQKQIIQEGR